MKALLVVLAVFCFLCAGSAVWLAPWFLSTLPKDAWQEFPTLLTAVYGGFGFVMLGMRLLSKLDDWRNF